jgi:hypothetical protein
MLRLWLLFFVCSTLPVGAALAVPEAQPARLCGAPVFGVVNGALIERPEATSFAEALALVDQYIAQGDPARAMLWAHFGILLTNSSDDRKALSKRMERVFAELPSDRRDELMREALNGASILCAELKAYSAPLDMDAQYRLRHAYWIVGDKAADKNDEAAVRAAWEKADALGRKLYSLDAKRAASHGVWRPAFGLSSLGARSWADVRDWMMEMKRAGNLAPEHEPWLQTALEKAPPLKAKEKAPTSRPGQ